MNQSKKSRDAKFITHIGTKGATARGRSVRLVTMGSTDDFSCIFRSMSHRAIFHEMFANASMYNLEFSGACLGHARPRAESP